MEAIREQIKNPIVIGVAAFILGTLFGLVILGWWLWPVQWVDANPEDLMSQAQTDYLRMAIEAFGYSGDGDTARARYAILGEGAEAALEAIVVNPAGMDPKLMVDFNSAISMEPEFLVTDSTTSDTVITQPVEEEETESKSLLQTLLPVLCVAIIVLVGAAVALYIIRARGSVSRVEPEQIVQEGSPLSHEVLQPQYAATTTEEPPLGRFIAAYKLGDDLFDDSFSIDSDTSEFLGDCGVGISESIGVGDPKKVTAFEVWLFDKNDIQTVTKVLMSAHAFGDNDLRQRLAAKGEPVLAELGVETILETQTLRLSARIVDMVYGDSAIPEESFFDRFNLELEVTRNA